MSFFAALRFLTIIPGPGHMEPGLSRPTRVAVSADAPVAVDNSLLQVGRSIAYFPVVGLIIGIILSLLYYGLHIILPVPVVSAVILAALAIITGAHHLDGLMDTCDGMVAGKTREERLAIMSDTRVGAFGITGACVILTPQICGYFILLNSRHVNRLSRYQPLGADRRHTYISAG